MKQLSEMSNSKAKAGIGKVQRKRKLTGKNLQNKLYNVACVAWQVQRDHVVQLRCQRHHLCQHLSFHFAL